MVSRCRVLRRLLGGAAEGMMRPLAERTQQVLRRTTDATINLASSPFPRCNAWPSERPQKRRILLIPPTFSTETRVIRTS